MGRQIVILQCDIPAQRQKRRPTKLDYICVTNRWKSMVTHSEVKWGPSIHRFGQAFDHGLLSVTWRWKTKTEKKRKRPDFAAMSDQDWPNFDENLRLKLQQKEEPASSNEAQRVQARQGIRQTCSRGPAFQNLRFFIPSGAFFES